MADHDQITAFRDQALAFCHFVEHTAASLSLPDRLSEARLALTALYAAACQLPKGDCEVEATATGNPAAAPSSWPGFGEADLYWEVFDPYEREEAVAGALSDDVLDIYRDLCAGFEVEASSDRGSAVWEWRFSFDSHWGEHAVDALRALHRACSRLAETQESDSRT